MQHKNPPLFKTILVIILGFLIAYAGLFVYDTLGIQPYKVLQHQTTALELLLVLLGIVVCSFGLRVESISNLVPPKIAEKVQHLTETYAARIKWPAVIFFGMTILAALANNIQQLLALFGRGTVFNETTIQKLLGEPAEVIVPFFCALAIYKLLKPARIEQAVVAGSFSLSYNPRKSFEGLLEKLLARVLALITNMPQKHPNITIWLGNIFFLGCFSMLAKSVGSLIGLNASYITAMIQQNWHIWIFPLVIAGFCLFRQFGKFFASILTVPEFLGNGITVTPVTIGGEGLLNMSFNGIWKWSDVHHIDVARDQANTGKQLLFSFRTGERASIDLDRLTQDSVEKLLLGIESWANPLCCSKALIKLKHEILTRTPEAVDQPATFTKMWEESLAQSFSATNFVPLKSGQELRSGRVKIVMPVSVRGLSSIYLAELTGGRRVVLKECTLPPMTDEAKRKKSEELFHREASILARLSHPRIVKVLDHFVESGREYMVLEYVSGMNLRQLVAAQGPQPERKVLEWAKAVCEILEYMHNQDPPVIHRDITPDNLMLGRDGKITLIDFGAASESISKVTGTIVGKQSYIAPEQFRGKATQKSDIYSLGCTMYFLLTGKDPEALNISSPQDICPQISDAVNKLVQKCTELEQSSRAETPAAIVSCIAEILSTEAGANSVEPGAERIDISKKDTVDR